MSNTMKNVEKIQGVINTIEMLEPIKPTAENASRLWGIFRTLFEVRDDLFKQVQEEEKKAENEAEEKKAEEKPAEVEENAGETDTE